MAKGRIISTGIWSDDFFSSLDPLQMIVWIGIITLADDQGRLTDNVKLIDAQIFQRFETDRPQIDSALAKFADTGRIIRYQVGDQKLIQIVNWWDHQSPSWASPSNYQSPEGWNDRVRYHGKGGKVITENWEECNQDIPQGRGQGIAQGSPQGRGQGRAINDVKDENENEVENEVDVESFTTTTTPIPIADDEPVGILRPLAQAFTAATHLPEGSGGHLWVEGLQTLYAMGASPGDIEIAVGELTRKNYHIASPASIIGAVANVMRKREERKPEAGINKYLRGYADHIKH